MSNVVTCSSHMLAGTQSRYWKKADILVCALIFHHKTNSVWLKDPWDVVAFQGTSAHLYVSDWESDCIWRVSAVDGQADQLIRDVGRAPRLSTTVKGELVAASDRGVTVYDTDHGKLRHIPVDGDARHAVMVADATRSPCFIVCCYRQHEVFILSLFSSRRILLSFHIHPLT